GGFKTRPYIIASAVLIACIIAFIIINRWDRLMNIDNPQNSITQRMNYWRTAIGVIKDHPFLGVGPGNFQEVFLKYKIGLSTNTRYAHNIFLHMWAEAGILGFAGVCFFLFSLLQKGLKNNKQKFIFLAIVVFILHNLIDNSYFIPETGLLWWAIMGLMF
ncbi:MAG: O-antigen ligase family protein, partial [Candidatus Omnitrophota bacterium]